MSLLHEPAHAEADLLLWPPCPASENKCNVGYAFVNMISSVHIISFYQEAFPINGICIHMLSKDDYPDNEEDDKGLNEKMLPRK
ncbi:hypothetical protein Zm00014a_003734 [Zea mays]|uniref:Mei2-like C-terminal RNA recognition motif domain-containing protein n=1 Tax=Zea mays TaxID=4577 RepID=A0A317YHZ4_MAIZE|nr:hypothetical protein Zm00014a_003734 [Zea mays]